MLRKGRGITMVKLYDKVKLKNGKFAVIVEILEPQKAYIADIENGNNDYETDTLYHEDIAALIVEVEQPLVTA
jgi:hypothetical protein